jgi:hypothetical protein
MLREVEFRREKTCPISRRPSYLPILWVLPSTGGSYRSCEKASRDWDKSMASICSPLRQFSSRHSKWSHQRPQSAFVCGISADLFPHHGLLAQFNGHASVLVRSPYRWSIGGEKSMKEYGIWLAKYASHFFLQNTACFDRRPECKLKCHRRAAPNH